MSDRGAPPRTRTAALLCGLLVVAVVSVVASVSVLVPAAAAHGGRVTAEVVGRRAVGDTSVRYELRLVYADGHAVEEAAPTAVAEGPDGASAGPVELVAGEAPGTYVGTVDFGRPGQWTVRFSSVEPEVTLSLTETVAAAPSTSPSTTTATSNTPSTSTAPSTTVPEVTAATPDATGSGLGTPDGDDGNGLLIALAVVAVVVLAGTFFITRRGKRRGS